MPLLHELLTTHWRDQNIRAQRLVAAMPHGFVGEHDMCTQDEIDHHLIYQEFLRPRGLGWGAATVMPTASGKIAVLSFDRPFELGPFKCDEIDQLNQLRPHLARAATIAAQIGLERTNGAIATLDALGIPAVAVERTGRVRVANRFVGDYPGQIEIGVDDRLRFPDPSAQASWKAVLAQLAQSGQSVGRSIVLPAGAEGHHPLVAHVIPLRANARDLFAGQEALLAFVPLNQPGLPFAALVRQLYDLTPAEARTAEALMQGLSASDIASRDGRKLETARSHIKNVLGKTGLARQSELVAKFSSLRRVD
jgi:DNA-binding CsgD family transcriptional regulator